MTDSPKSIFRYIVGLVAVFSLGFALLVVLHFSFLEILARFDQELESESSRIAIGEVIIANVHMIERNFYLLATLSTGPGSVEKLYTRTESFFAHIEEAFAVFSNGGSLTTTIALNQEGMQDFSRDITYDPHGQEKYVLEIMDIRPKVFELRERLQALAYLVSKRNALMLSGDQKALDVVRDDILIFLKKTPSHFVRLHENANGLYYQGYRNLERLKGKIARRKAYHTRVSIGVMAAIIVAVLAICWHIARQIYAAHSQLDFVRREMEKARKEAESASKIKSEFLATMGHEVRTPMNIIVGMTGLVMGTKLTTTQQRYMGRIQSAAEILLGLLDDILDFSKIEHGKLELADQPFNLKELVCAIAEVVKLEGRQKGVAVEVSVAEAPWIPSGDPWRMRQILLILVSNAVKFTPKGKVEIQAALEELDPHWLLVVVTVRDTGIGIAKEQLATIFDSFSQGDASVTRQYGGTGLGLAISNQLAKLMGGEITVESTVGQGSIFTLTLPMRKASSPVAYKAPSLAVASGKGPVKALEILLIDSDSAQQEVAQALLEKAGHRVKTGENGLEALRCMAKFQYDVVFLALAMPVLDGRDAAQNIRAFEKGEAVERIELGYDIDWLSARLSGQHTFLVAVSDHPQPKNKALAKDTLFDDQVCKPYTQNELADLVNRLVGGSK
jgi:signal transduction histidine kinase